jgi:hypothetical protein
MTWPPITQADIEARHKPREVRSAACDDGSGVAGTSLTTAIATACRRGQLILGRAWPAQSQIEALVAGDDAINGALCDMAMYELTKRVKAWIGPDGKPLLFQVNKDAEAMLTAIADAQLRSNGEATAGLNPRYADRVNIPVASQETQFVFAPTVGKPTPGGY